ncbi:tumor necrosis factor receptor superfamily member 5-like [Ptychodera flava]|uniref:tumor necrosis factor receptor superfamily member 5-like n=1 Tax=Ptychodera flava TaxID=63121 RepID=UPI00396AB0EB
MIISSLSRTTWTFLSLIVILSLLQKNQIYVHGFPTETCSSRDRKYTHNGVCCYMCPPGYRVESHCQLNLDDSSCKPCPQGYFQGDWNSQTDCFRVNLCNKSHEHVAEEANKDGTSDNTCACDVGYEYSGSGERCRKAALTVIVTPRSHITDVTTTNALSSSSWSWFWSSSSLLPSPTPKTGSKVSTGDSSKLTIHILVALLCSFIFFVILGLALWRYRKKIRVCIKQQENRKQIGKACIFAHMFS